MAAFADRFAARRGFTLIEMLVVVTVLVILMTIAFRLGGVGSDQEKRNLTIARMQRLENCLSGYYAAYGTYPPVRLHGSRNINTDVQDYNGLQLPDNYPGKAVNWANADEAWKQVGAACRSQPLGMAFPFRSGMKDYVNAVGEMLKTKAGESKTKTEYAKFAKGLGCLQQGNVNNVNDEVDWREAQLFKFGLMSFLLPRYQIMLGMDSSFANAVLGKVQWTENNVLPCDSFTGNQYTNWKELNTRVYRGFVQGNTEERARVENIAAEAIPLRWLPNLERICSVNYTITVRGITLGDNGYYSALRSDNSEMEVYTFNLNSSEQPYALDTVTVLDGWMHEFYYYSPPPHQSYVLWSAGPNGRTFPPWLSRETLESATARKLAAEWLADDIIHMSN